MEAWNSVQAGLCVRTFAEMRRDVCDDKLYIVDIEDMHMDIDKSEVNARPATIFCNRHAVSAYYYTHSVFYRNR